MLILLVLSYDRRVVLRNGGLIARLHGQSEMSRSLLERVVNKDRMLYWHLYGLYDQLGDANNAMESLRRSGFDWQTLMGIGDGYIWPAQDWEQALLWYTKTRKVHENSTILFKLGRVYELSGDSNQAFVLYQQSLQIDVFEGNEVGRSAVLTRLATIHRSYFNDVEQALVLTTDALALDRFGELFEEKAQAFYLVGEIGAKQGRDASYCIEQYQRAIELSPTHFWANLLLGQEYYRAGLPLEKAVRQIEHAISLQSQNKWGYLILAGLYAKAEDIDAAKRWYHQVLTLDSDDQTASQFLAQHP